MEFNEKLQELRRKKGLTQEELAAALYVSRTAVSKWESGRGYPNIASLKQIAAVFSVTVDELLSGEEWLTVAEENADRKARHYRDLCCGFLDAGTAMLLFLPLFAQQAAGQVEAVSLLSLTAVAPYVRITYLVLVALTAATGVVTLALQNITASFWLQLKSSLSLFLGVAGVLLFVLGRQPYAAVFVFLFLAIKALLLIKRR